MTLPDPLPPQGQLEVLGRIGQASNAIFLVRDEASVNWVYKPVAGERALWDFPPHTLGRREVAAYLVSAGAGFDVVPFTTWADGPLGEGSFQLWVEGTITDQVDLLRPEDVDETWLAVATGVDADDKPVVIAHRDTQELRRICLFDLIINNSDRKAGHLIYDGTKLHGIDHGVSFSVEEKNRTVLWGFAGTELDDEALLLLKRVTQLATPVPEGLTEAEWDQLNDRAGTLLASGTYPAPSGQWPALPWPPW